MKVVRDVLRSFFVPKKNEDSMPSMPVLPPCYSPCYLEPTLEDTGFVGYSFKRGSVASTNSSIESLSMTYPVTVMIVEEKTRTRITDIILFENTTVSEFRRRLRKLIPRNKNFRIIRCHDGVPVRMGYEKICCIEECSYFLQGSWVINIQLYNKSGKDKISSQQRTYPASTIWQSLAQNISSDVLLPTDDDEIRRSSTTSERNVLTVPQIYVSLRDIFHHVFYLQRGSPFCKLNVKVKFSLEESLVSLSYRAKEPSFSNILLESELWTLKSHLSCAHRLNGDEMICAGELVTCLSQILNLVQKLLINTSQSGNKVRSKEDTDIPSVSTADGLLPQCSRQSPDKDNKVVYQLQSIPKHDIANSSTEHNEVLDTLDEILARYDESTDNVQTITANLVAHCKQDSGGTIICHQKQGSDCTIINEFYHEIEYSIDHTEGYKAISSDPVEASEAGEKSVDPPNTGKSEPSDKITFRGLLSAIGSGNLWQKDNQNEPPNDDIIDDDIINNEVFVESIDDSEDLLEIRGPEDECDEIENNDTDLLSNIVTFIRTNSMRIKRSLGKDGRKRVDSDANDSLLEVDVLHPAGIPNDQQPCSSVDKLIDVCEKHTQDESATGFEEICKPVYGYVRRSESGPITLHKNDHRSYREERALATVPLYRPLHRHDIEDSGFESSSCYTPIRRKKKCHVPFKVITQVLNQTYDRLSPTNFNNFQFRESSSPTASRHTDAVRPALTDVSDDDDDERVEIFFGKFPGMSKIPLKAERDLAGHSSAHLVFSDSDEEDKPRRKEKKVRPLTILDGLHTPPDYVKLDNIDISHDVDDDIDIIISPLPGDNDNLEELFSENYETIEMICESNLLERRILTGRLVLWTPDYRQKVKKVYISKQRSGMETPEKSAKLSKDSSGRWSLCQSPENRSSSRTMIFLTVETDTERSESVSTTATSPLLDPDQNEENMNTDEELYYNMREEMRNLDQMGSNCDPDNQDLPVSVIDYMNRGSGP